MTIEYRTENCRRCGRLKSIRVAVSGSGAEYHSICDDCGRAELREKGQELRAAQAETQGAFE